MALFRYTNIRRRERILPRFCRDCAACRPLLRHYSTTIIPLFHTVCHCSSAFCRLSASFRAMEDRTKTDAILPLSPTSAICLSVFTHYSADVTQICHASAKFLPVSAIQLAPNLDRCGRRRQGRTSSEPQSGLQRASGQNKHSTSSSIFAEPHNATAGPHTTWSSLVFLARVCWLAPRRRGP